MMQNTQYPTGREYRFSQELRRADFAVATITLSNNEVVKLLLLEDDDYGWLTYAFMFYSLLTNGAVNNHAPLFNILDYMNSKGVNMKHFKQGEHYVRIKDSILTDILLTPEGVKELANLSTQLGVPFDDAYIIFHWAREYKFLGIHAKETIIKKREELIKSNADGYMMDSYQLSKALGIRPDSIRMTKCRHTNKLIEGVHWRYSSNGHRTLLFTKLGCLVMSSLVSTKEAQETKVFFERIFGVANEELSLAE